MDTCTPCCWDRVNGVGQRSVCNIHINIDAGLTSMHARMFLQMSGRDGKTGMHPLVFVTRLVKLSVVKFNFVFHC